MASEAQDSVSAETRKGRVPTMPTRRVLRRKLVGERSVGAGVDRAPPRPRPLSDRAVRAGRPPRGAVRALRVQLRGRAGARDRDNSRCSARSGCNGGGRSSMRPMPGHRPGGTRSWSRWSRRSPSSGCRARISTGSSIRASAISPTRRRPISRHWSIMPRAPRPRLVYLALEALGAAEPATVAAARDVGIAYALAGLLRAMPFHAASGRSYIPDDVAVRIGLDPATYVTAPRHAGVAQRGRGAGRGGGDPSRGGRRQRGAKSAAGSARRCCRR